MITVGGIGSGIDVDSIIDQLMVAERQPMQALETRKAVFGTQISAFGQVSSALSRLQDSVQGLADEGLFDRFSASSGDETVFTASAAAGAGEASFDIEVTQLAQRQGSASQAFADADTTAIGNAGDTLSFVQGDGGFSVEIGGLTLNQIRDAINDAADNTGIRANVIADTPDSARLVLSSSATGSSNAFSIETSNAGAPIADPLGTSLTRAAADATLVLDGGLSVSRASNQIDDLIEGVTLELKSVSAGAVSLDIGRDNQAVGEALDRFVSSYNALASTLETQGRSTLPGESALFNISSRILRELGTGPGQPLGGLNFALELGVSVNDEGRLSLDRGRLDEALSGNPEGVRQLLSNEDAGIMSRLDRVIEGYLGSGGLIESRTNGLRSRIDQVDSRLEGMEFRLGRTEARLRSQFAALDSLVGSLQSTGNFITQQLSQLPGFTRSNG